MWTRMAAPRIRAGSRPRRSRWSARMDVYSEPCVPATRASTGPGAAPLATVTGIRVPGSTPSETSIQPDASWPEVAITLPTVRVVDISRLSSCTVVADDSARDGRGLPRIRRDKARLATRGLHPASLAQLAPPGAEVLRGLDATALPMTLERMRGGARGR